MKECQLIIQEDKPETCLNCNIPVCFYDQSHYTRYENRNSQITELYRQGTSLNIISNQFNISIRQIHRILIHWN